MPTKKWCEQSAEIEDNSEIGAGCPPTTGSLASRFAALPVDIQDALADVGEEMIRARAKFPGTKHLTAALMEEVGEVAKELLEDGENLWGECVQTACVALRIATEGDADFEGASVKTRNGCAACDRGDYQLGHAEWCPANARGVGTGGGEE